MLLGILGRFTFCPHTLSPKRKNSWSVRWVEHSRSAADALLCCFAGGVPTSFASTGPASCCRVSFYFCLVLHAVFFFFFLWKVEWRGSILLFSFAFGCLLFLFAYFIVNGGFGYNCLTQSHLGPQGEPPRKTFHGPCCCLEVLSSTVWKKPSLAPTADHWGRVPRHGSFITSFFPSCLRGTGRRTNAVWMLVTRMNNLWMVGSREVFCQGEL